MKREENSKEKKNRFFDYFKGKIFPIPTMHNHDTPFNEIEFVRLSKSFKNVVDKMEEKDKEND